MKVSHESPLCLMQESRSYNDYDYALVHLFEKNKEYYNFFKESLSMGREVILDNSIFELGEAFDMERFLYWINELKPTFYIIPDVLDDAEGTMNNIDRWMKEFAPRVEYDAKIMCVVQGKNYTEAIECYKTAEKYADKIAFSFNCMFYHEKGDNVLLNWLSGRQRFIYYLDSMGILNRTKMHHLLGCALPQEFLAYRCMPYITSVDTSNPIVHGLYRVKYKDFGLYRKVDTMLHTLINTEVDEQQLACIRYNVNKFKEFANA